MMNMRFANGVFIESSMVELFGMAPSYDEDFDDFMARTGLEPSMMCKSYDPDGVRPFINTYSKHKNGCSELPFVAAYSLNGVEIFYIGADSQFEMCMALFKLIPVVAGSEALITQKI